MRGGEYDVVTGFGARDGRDPGVDVRDIHRNVAMQARIAAGVDPGYVHELHAAHLPVVREQIEKGDRIGGYATGTITSELQDSSSLMASRLAGAPPRAKARMISENRYGNTQERMPSRHPHVTMP
jgi:hypothetical protein